MLVSPEPVRQLTSVSPVGTFGGHSQPFEPANHQCAWCGRSHDCNHRSHRTVKHNSVRLLLQPTKSDDCAGSGMGDSGKLTVHHRTLPHNDHRQRLHRGFRREFRVRHSRLRRWICDRISTARIPLPDLRRGNRTHPSGLHPRLPDFECRDAGLPDGSNQAMAIGGALIPQTFFARNPNKRAAWRQPSEFTEFQTANERE